MEQKYPSAHPKPKARVFTKAEFHRFLGIVNTKNRYQLVRAAFGCAAVYGFDRVKEIKNLRIKGKERFIWHIYAELARLLKDF